MADCRSCRHFRRETESWEFPDIWWYECRKRPGAPNLTSFPFVNTNCKAFEPKPAPLTQDEITGLREVLKEALAEHDLQKAQSEVPK